MALDAFIIDGIYGHKYTTWGCIESLCDACAPKTPMQICGKCLFLKYNHGIDPDFNIDTFVIFVNLNSIFKNMPYSILVMSRVH